MAGNTSDKQTGGNPRSMFNIAHRGSNVASSILRLPAVLKKRGRSRSAHYLDIQEGLFTRPVSIGSRAVGWPVHEVDAINAARIAGKCEDEIRQLVAKLEAARKSAL
jgi:prophage regulatory protein